MDNKMKRVIVCSVAVVVLLLVAFLRMNITPADKTEKETKSDTMPSAYTIQGVPVLKQEELKAGCETYACTMLLQSLGVGMDEFEFADNYLVEKMVFENSEDDWYGPDMDSAYAGEIEWGYGVNSPAMAKFMNNMLSDKKTGLTATALKGVTLEKLCEEYIVNDIPVMVWATTNMQEPYVKLHWTVNYVDSSVSDAQIGDTESWLQNEHCLVLIGFDEKNYYFADSVAGEVSCFEKEICEDRYEKLDMQAIVVK